MAYQYICEISEWSILEVKVNTVIDIKKYIKKIFIENYFLNSNFFLK